MYGLGHGPVVCPLCKGTTFSNLFSHSTEIAFQEVGPVLAPRRPEQLSLFGPAYEAPPVGAPDLSGSVLVVALSAISWLLIGYLIWMLA